ncbi:Cache 3/Cache 2 fusion domain-containing protein [Roseibium salinum]|nr:Cache 3/Cache 2 fusion domain-containing protein [Roseibium salinum]
MVLCSIGLVSGLSYLELSRASEENAAIRIDRAARAAVALLGLGTDSALRAEFDDAGSPIAMRIAGAADPLAGEELTGLAEAIGRANQGSVNLFRWSPETASFNRFASTLTRPDGGPQAAVSIQEGHPAYSSLIAGKPFTGRVPVDGRSRPAYLAPILADDGEVAGAFAVDIGPLDDLTRAENRLRGRIAAVAISVLTGVVLIGGPFSCASSCCPCASSPRPPKILPAAGSPRTFPIPNGRTRSATSPTAWSG